tara:strand:- start:197 stop:310 length:114 start_codon:yes stop_codon:yes gene_type:complete
MFSEFFKKKFNSKKSIEKAVGIANKNAELFKDCIKPK